MRRHLATAVRLAAVIALGLAWAVSIPLVQAQDAKDAALLEALRDGGYVLYFRHARTDWAQNDQVRGEGSWTSCDPERMRQLSEAGRERARRVGAAMRELGIPVAEVFSSEYCRCVQTAELLDVGPVTTTRDILNARAAEFVGGSDALRRAARTRLATPPPEGRNTVLVAHGNVFVLAAGSRPPEGGAVVVRPQGGQSFEVLGTITAEDWLALAAAD